MLALLAQSEPNEGDLILNIGEKAQDVLPGAETVVNEGAGVGVANLISLLLEVAFILAGIAVLFFLIWGAIEWITAAGDSSKIENARNKILQAVVGLLVLSATVALFNLLQNFLNVELINFRGLVGGGGGGRSTNPAASCQCGNGEYASIGQVGRLTYAGDTCCRCTTSGWDCSIEETGCGIIDCHPLDN